MALLNPKAVSIPAVLTSIKSHWSPKLIATTNNHDLKIAKISDDFIWHAHPNSDELFLCLKGTFTMRFKEHTDTPLDDVHLKEGDVLVVPRGVRHLPSARDGEASILMVELKGTVNIGDAEGQEAKERRRVANDVRC